jgi:hypothetical protein
MDLYRDENEARSCGTWTAGDRHLDDCAQTLLLPHSESIQLTRSVTGVEEWLILRIDPRADAR